MKSRLICTLALASAFSFTSVNADTFNYSYIEGGIGDYYEGEVDLTFLVGGSYNMSKNFNLLADYSTTTIGSEGSVDFDLNYLTFGVGYHRPINKKSDVVASIKYVSADITATNGLASAEVVDADGFSTGVGVRYKVNDKVEAEIGLEYMDIEDDSETQLLVSGRYYFNEKLSAALHYGSREDKGIAGTIRLDY